MGLREQTDERLKENGIMSFVGPPAPKIGDVPYMVITSYGIKHEGESLYNGSKPTISTEVEAIDRFMRVLDWETRNCGQLAWRRFPAIQKGESGDVYVSARFAVLGCRQPVAVAA